MNFLQLCNRWQKKLKEILRKICSLHFFRQAVFTNYFELQLYAWLLNEMVKDKMFGSSFWRTFLVDPSFIGVTLQVWADGFFSLQILKFVNSSWCFMAFWHEILAAHFNFFSYTSVEVTVCVSQWDWEKALSSCLRIYLWMHNCFTSIYSPSRDSIELWDVCKIVLLCFWDLTFFIQLNSGLYISSPLIPFIKLCISKWATEACCCVKFDFYHQFQNHF